MARVRYMKVSTAPSGLFQMWIYTILTDFLFKESFIRLISGFWMFNMPDLIPKCNSFHKICMSKNMSQRSGIWVILALHTKHEAVYDIHTA